MRRRNDPTIAVRFSDCAPVGVDVLVDHAIAAESFDRQSSNGRPVEATDLHNCVDR
jgi:hypothetical protein